MSTRQLERDPFLAGKGRLLFLIWKGRSLFWDGKVDPSFLRIARSIDIESTFP
ncbi:hypothetical protein [Microcoleus sp. D2_18a_D3]|uniref:hypothetical protein n=1 Tax=Microcoleus sp. D2_18a_D3 TaxID=3055330 RepID=UPI002FD516A2